MRLSTRGTRRLATSMRGCGVRGNGLGVGGAVDERKQKKTQTYALRVGRELHAGRAGLVVGGGALHVDVVLTDLEWNKEQEWVI